MSPRGCDDLRLEEGGGGLIFPPKRLALSRTWIIFTRESSSYPASGPLENGREFSSIFLGDKSGICQPRAVGVLWGFPAWGRGGGDVVVVMQFGSRLNENRAREAAVILCLSNDLSDDNEDSWGRARWVHGCV